MPLALRLIHAALGEDDPAIVIVAVFTGAKPGTLAYHIPFPFAQGRPAQIAHMAKPAFAADIVDARQDIAFNCDEGDCAEDAAA